MLALFSWMAGGLLGLAAAEADGLKPDPAPPRSGPVALKAAAVHDGLGGVHRPGVLVVQDGKVAVIGGADVAVPEGARVVECAGEISPGLVDAACQLGTPRVAGWTEHSSEVVPQYDLADAIDYFSRDFERLVAGGVTTIYLTPEAASVIGGLGVGLKTAGPIDQRRLQAAPYVKACIGPETARRGAFNRAPGRGAITFLNRRPTTRMGSAWVFREAFYQAIEYRNTGTSGGDPEAMQVLGEVLAGNIGLRFQARMAHDIDSADRLASEFGLSFVLESGTEAYRRLDMLSERKIPVIYGPIYVQPQGVTRSSGDSGVPCLTTATQLAERGVPFCLTASDLTGETGLARQAGAAMRYGLAADTALKAVTSAAAGILGLDGQVGSLAPGRDADLVLWSGAPLVDTSKAVLVMIGGEVAYDPAQLLGAE